MEDTNQLEALRTVLEGDIAKLSREYASSFNIKYNRVKTEILDLTKVSQVALPRLLTLAAKTEDRLLPHQTAFQSTDLEDFALFRWLNHVSIKMLQQMNASTISLTAINHAALLINPVFKGNAEFGQISTAGEAAAELIEVAQEEYQRTALQFNPLVAEIYLTTRKEYKSMRRKYLGETARAEAPDDLENQMFMRMFGMKPPEEKSSAGSARALIDGNCVLTQLLEDLSEIVPKHYERVVPEIKRGKITTTTKSIKQLDDGEVEEFVYLLDTLSNQEIIEYLADPQSLLAEIMDALIKFYDIYLPVKTALENLAKGMAVVIHKAKDQQMSNPRALERRFRNINFLAIQPTVEDTTPRNRADRDYSTARLNLLIHLHETLTKASAMKDSNEYLELRVKEAIELKATLVDVSKTEHDRQIQRNIQDDNEFYVGATGEIGALDIKRDAAPRITYKDVIGASFIETKAHIEEVVELASHPHIMRISAPRGDVKSNIMLIGPFGCGKTEMGRAVGSDPRIIGLSISTADLLTPYMHQSVKNIKLLYDHASELRKGSRYTKPVGIILDEFDRLFTYGTGVNTAYDGNRMEGALQETMDGMIEHEGVFLVTLTNNPKAVPEAVLRRFKYVNVVGQLTDEERVILLKQFLSRGLPIDSTVTDEHYMTWAKGLEHAPGDVLGKIADEVHFKFMREFVEQNRKEVVKIERTLAKRLLNREINDIDRGYLKKALAKHRTIGVEPINEAMRDILNQPQVKMQIRKAKEVYRDAEEILHGLTLEKGVGFKGEVGKKNELWGR